MNEQQIITELERNPFASRGPKGWPIPVTVTCDAESRLQMVREFNAEELRKVLALDGVQKTVRAAAERRLRKLERHRSAVQTYRSLAE